MKKYTKKIITDATQFKDLAKGTKPYIASFQNGKLISMETDNLELINFAKSKGLKL